MAPVFAGISGDDQPNSVLSSFSFVLVSFKKIYYYYLLFVYTPTVFAIIMEAFIQFNEHEEKNLD